MQGNEQRIRQKVHAVFILIFMVSCLSFLTGCGNQPATNNNNTNNTNNSNNNTNKTEDKNGLIRFIHMSYDAPGVDLLLGDKALSENVQYGESSGFQKVEAGKKTLSVLQTGTDSPELLKVEKEVTNKTRATLIAFNKASSIQYMELTASQKTNADKALVRFVHTVTDAPAVDIKAGSASSKSLFAGIAFGKKTDFLEADEKEYEFIVTPAGKEDIVVAFEPVKLEKGKIYTVIARGTLDANDNYAFGVRVFIDNEDGKAFVDLTPKQTQPPTDKDAFVRVIHGVYAAGGVDLSVDGSVAAKGLEYRKTTGYLKVKAGQRELQVTPANQPNPTLIDAQLTFDADKSYTLIALPDGSNVKAASTEDQRAPNATKAKIRLLHASPDAPSVDIKVGTPDSQAVISNIAFEKSSSYIEVDSGAYAFVVTATGANQAVVSFEPVGLEAGKVYTAVAFGTLDAKDKYPFGVRVFVDNGDGKAFVDLKVKATKPPTGKSKLRVIHGSFDAPAVDIAVDGNKAFTGLAYRQSSGYAEVEEGKRKVEVFASGGNQSVLAREFTLNKNTDYTVFALNELQQFEVVATDDKRLPEADKAKIRLVHGSSDAPAVDVKLSTGTGASLFSNAAFKSVSAYKTVDAKSYTLVLTAQGSDKALLTFEPIALAKGQVYTAVAFGTLDAKDKYPFGVRVFVDNGDGKAFVDLKIKKPVAQDKANIRVLHFSHDAPAVDIRLNGNVAIKGLTYKQSSGYANVVAEKKKVQVTPTGKSTPVVIEANLELKKDTDYTVLAVGSLSQIGPILSTDARKADANKAKVRFVHAASDAPAVDIKVGSASGTAVFTNAAFKKITPYITVDEGSYSFVVTPTGKTTQVVAFEAVKLEKGKIYTVVAHGTLSAKDKFPFGVRVFIDNGDGKAFVDLKAKTPPPAAKSKVRVLHMSYDAPAVDVAVDGAVAIKSLAYKASSGYATLNAGSRKVAVTPAGKKTPVVISATLNLAKNTDYTVFAAGILGKIGPVVSVDSRSPSTTRAKIRFAHLSPDAPAVDIRVGSATGTRVFTNASFKKVSPYTSVGAGSYSFVVTPAGKTSAVVSFEPVSLQRGQVYTVVAHGTLNAKDKFPFGVRVFIDNGNGNTFVDLKAKTPPPAAKSKVRVLHMSYDAPAVDVAVDGAVAIKSLAYKASSGYATLDAGNRKVTVTPAGKSTPTVISATLGLAKDKDYTVFAVDQLSKIGPIVSVDSRSPSATQARVRFVHASPDAPAVDIRVGSGSGTRVFSNAAFKRITGYSNVAPGSYSFVVTPAGRTNTVVAFEAITLERGKVYTVVAHGTLNAGDRYPFGVRAFVDNGDGKAFVDLKAKTNKAKVRLLHMSYDAPPVDVRVDGTLALRNLAYRGSSGYAELNPGTRRLQVTPAGRTTPVVINSSVPFVANRDYTLIAVDRLTRITAIGGLDARAPNANKAKVRFVHASPDAPAVDIKVGSATGPRVFANATFKRVTSYIEVNEGSYSFVVTAANGTQAVVSFEAVKLEKGKVYTVVAHGTLNANDRYPFGVRAFVDNGDGKAFVDLKIAVPTSRVNFVNAFPYSPTSVDIYINNRRVRSSLNYRTNSGYIRTAVGSLSIEFRQAGTTRRLSRVTLRTTANKNYSVFLTGLRFIVNVYSVFSTEDDLRLPATGRVKVRFAHASSNAGNVDIWVRNGPRLFSNRSYRSTSSFITVNPGTYNLDVRRAGSTSVILRVNSVTLQANKIYTIYARGIRYRSGSTALGASIFTN